VSYTFPSDTTTLIGGPSNVPGRGIVVTNAGVPLRIGDPAAGCAGNRVSGEIILTGNTAGLILGSNTVTRAVTVNGNTGGTPVIKANTIASTLACSGNDPPPTNAGQPNTAPAKTGQCAAL
jgi:hexosaminidase